MAPARLPPSPPTGHPRLRAGRRSALPRSAGTDAPGSGHTRSAATRGKVGPRSLKLPNRRFRFARANAIRRARRVVDNRRAQRLMAAAAALFEHVPLGVHGRRRGRADDRFDQTFQDRRAPMQFRSRSRPEPAPMETRASASPSTGSGADARGSPRLRVRMADRIPAGDRAPPSPPQDRARRPRSACAGASRCCRGPVLPRRNAAATAAATGSTSPSSQPRRGEDESMRSDSGCASIADCLIRTTSRASARGSAPAIRVPAGISIGRSLNECTTISASPAMSA